MIHGAIILFKQLTDCRREIHEIEKHKREKQKKRLKREKEQEHQRQLELMRGMYGGQQSAQMMPYSPSPVSMPGMPPPGGQMMYSNIPPPPMGAPPARY